MTNNNQQIKIVFDSLDGVAKNLKSATETLDKINTKIDELIFSINLNNFFALDSSSSIKLLFAIMYNFMFHK